MASTINARVALRRNPTATYEEHPNFIPLQGEVCFEDTSTDGLKIKVGDGHTTFKNLDYELINVVFGYYYNGDFYYDDSHSAYISALLGKLYIDLS